MKIFFMFIIFCYKGTILEWIRVCVCVQFTL